MVVDIITVNISKYIEIEIIFPMLISVGIYSASLHVWGGLPQRERGGRIGQPIRLLPFASTIIISIIITINITIIVTIIIIISPTQ